MQNKHVWLQLVLLIFGVASLCLYSGCGTSRAAAETDGCFWGRADAKEIDVHSKISGRVVQLNVKEGDLVKQGQIIARIDQRDLLTQAAQASAAVDALRAQQTQAAAQTAMQDGTTHSDVAAAVSAVNSAEANLSLAKADFLRYQELVGEGAVPQQLFETYRTKYQTSQAAYAAAQASLVKAQAALLQVDVNRDSEEVLQRKLTEAKAAKSQIQVSLDETLIRAPFDGVITAKYIEEGSMISQGTPLVAVQDSLDNWVDFKVPETKLPQFSLQQQLILEARDGKTQVQGTVVDISKKSEFATTRATSERGDASDIVSFNVKVQVNAKELRPGMRFRFVGVAEQ